MPLVLRPYQSDLIMRTRAAFATGARSVVMQSPTGSGKTTMAAEIIRGALERKRRVAFFARLTVLIDDTHERLIASGIRAGIVQSNRKADPEALVQVASLDTLASRQAVPDANLCILDECHCAPSEDVKGVLGLHPITTKLLGLTATPCRADDAPLVEVFEALVQGPSVKELITAGALVPVYIVSTKLKRGIDGNALSAAPVDAYVTHTPNGRAIVFASSVKHADAISRDARARGIATLTITGKSSRDERRLARTMLATGPCIITSVDVFREGWDAPPCDTIILARGFSHVGSYLQAIGRGMRAATGKTHCTVLDLHESYLTCGFPDEDRVWSLGEVAVRRVDKSNVLHRCLECGAVFRVVGPCPRCGATAKRQRAMPRILSSAEKLERIEAIADPVERDRALLSALRRRAFVWAGSERAEFVARAQFKKKHGREPLCA
jgi:superfamily II DNA or RNA helicase